MVPGDRACGRCGVVFARANAARRAPAPSAPPPVPGGAGWGSHVWRHLTWVDPEDGLPVAAGRALLLVLLAWWGWRFAQLNRPWGVWDSHFLHNAHLVFHEAGHLLFAPFGRFMSIAGGSLMQLLIPLAAMAGFLYARPQPFGAAVATWWLGTSLIDLSPYIGDAQSLKLMMIGGFLAEDVPDAHDWRNLLYSLELLRHDRLIATVAWNMGGALMILGLAWGSALVVRQIQNPGA